MQRKCYTESAKKNLCNYNINKANESVVINNVMYLYRRKLSSLKFATYTQTLIYINVLNFISNKPNHYLIILHASTARHKPPSSSAPHLHPLPYIIIQINRKVQTLTFLKNTFCFCEQYNLFSRKSVVPTSYVFFQPTNKSLF